MWARRLSDVVTKMPLNCAYIRCATYGGEVRSRDVHIMEIGNFAKHKVVTSSVATIESSHGALPIVARLLPPTAVLVGVLIGCSWWNP